eukprot:gene22462-57406_t
MREGSLRVCGAGQFCIDTDTTTLGTFNCTCLLPFEGSRAGGPATCWHDDCRDDPCGEEQTCADPDPRGRGKFHCSCTDGFDGSAGDDGSVAGMWAMTAALGAATCLLLVLTVLLCRERRRAKRLPPTAEEVDMAPRQSPTAAFATTGSAGEDCTVPKSGSYGRALGADD